MAHPTLINMVLETLKTLGLSAAVEPRDKESIECFEALDGVAVDGDYTVYEYKICWVLCHIKHYNQNSRIVPPEAEEESVLSTASFTELMGKLVEMLIEERFIGMGEDEAEGVAKYRKQA